MSLLFPEMRISRPDHPTAKADGFITVDIERDVVRDGVIVAMTLGYGRTWLSAAEKAEAKRILEERDRQIAEISDRAEARKAHP